MLKSDKYKHAIYNMVKCITENKMSSAVNHLSDAVNESIKNRIKKAIIKSSK